MIHVVEPIDVVQTVLLVLVAVAAFIVPITIYRRLIEHVRSEVSRLTKRVDQNLAAAVKLHEVRDYHQGASAELKKMLDEAYKDGNRSRQEQIRKLMQRLDTLKVRTLDTTVSVLDSDDKRRPRRRRRKSRGSRSRKKSPDQQKSVGKTGSPPPSQRKNNSQGQSV